MSERICSAQSDRASSAAETSPPTLLRQPPHDFHRFQADADDLADEADDVFFVVGAVGVGADAAAFVGLDAVLIYNPLQGTTVAEPIGEHVRGNPGQGERVVDYEGGLVLAELHSVHAVRERHVVRFDPLQGIRFKGLVFEMQPGKLLAGGSECLKVRGITECAVAHVSDYRRTFPGSRDGEETHTRNRKRPTL